MGRQRTINDKKFWNSPKMAGRTQEDRATLVYLLTCTSSNIVGSYSIVPRIAAAEMGWDTESQFMPVLKRLCDSDFIKYDAETSFVWVRIWWEHNSPKMALAPTLRQKSIKQIREMPAHWISDYLDDMAERLQESDEYREMLIQEFQASSQSGNQGENHRCDATDRVSIPHRQPMDRPEDDYSSQTSGENTEAAIRPEAEGSRRGKPEGHAQENRVSVPYLSHIPRGAGNYNPNNNYKNNNTTTDRLIFPHDLSRAAQASIEEALLQVSDTDAQKLLDELAAAIASKKVKTTITQLFHGLLKIYHQGKLQPSSGAIAIANKRSQNGGVGQEAIATLKRKMLINGAKTMQLQFKELENYCDSLEHSGNIQVILHAHYAKGFALTVSDGTIEHPVTDEQNHPYWFRTVEMALDELANIPFISDKIMIDRTSWS